VEVQPLLRFPAIVILICALFLPAFSEDKSEIGVIEKPAQDTVARRNSTPKDSGNLSNSKTAIVIPDSQESKAANKEHPFTKEKVEVVGKANERYKDLLKEAQNLETVLSSGMAFTTLGFILHASGLGLLLAGVLTPTNDRNLTLDFAEAGLVGQCAGPIFSCVGATRVEHRLRDNGFEADNPHVCAEYGFGWLSEGGGITLAAAALEAAVVFGESGGAPSNDVSKVDALAIGAAACFIAAEVEWMRCVIRSRTYISRMERKVHFPHANIRIVPYFSFKGAAGAAMLATF
jgi:hypothetical protein